MSIYYLKIINLSLLFFKNNNKMNNYSRFYTILQQNYKLINKPIYHMRQARRLFGKNKNPSLQSSSSSVFKSKILRDLPNQSKYNSIGPGQYDVSLPIVKPKFEAIRKNNNTIIIKVNDKCSPVFQSLQPRFKQSKSLKNQNNILDEANQVIHERSQRKYLETEKISNGMRNRIQKLTQILSVQNRQSKKSLGTDSNQKSVDKLENLEQSTEVVNSLKLYKKQRERLHFLLKYIKPNNTVKKGVQWSKYRQTKGNLYSVNNVPGPGSYQEKDYRTTNHRYYQTIEEKSWQFKSLTRRGYYQNKQQKKYEISPPRNRFVSDINGKFYKVDSVAMFHDKSQQKISIDKDEI